LRGDAELQSTGSWTHPSVGCSNGSARLWVPFSLHCLTHSMGWTPRVTQTPGVASCSPLLHLLLLLLLLRHHRPRGQLRHQTDAGSAGCILLTGKGSAEPCESKRWRTCPVCQAEARPPLLPRLAATITPLAPCPSQHTHRLQLGADWWVHGGLGMSVEKQHAVKVVGAFPYRHCFFFTGGDGDVFIPGH